MDTAAHNEAPRQASLNPQSTALGKRKRSTSIQDACVICLSPISERAITVPCNHLAFDFLCLISWLQSHPRCPLCNAQVTAVQYDWCGPDDYKTYAVEPPAVPQKAASAPAGPHNGSRGGLGAARGRLPRTCRSRAAIAAGPDAALLRRRAVYAQKLYSLHVGSNPHSRYRDFTPAAFAKDENLQSRARAFIRRELRVFEFLDPLAQPPASTSSSAGTTPTPMATTATATKRRQNNADFLLEYVVAILRTTEPKGGRAEDLLQEFLGRENARLFLHELEAWLRSPFRRLEDWDRHVQYAGEIPDGVRGKGSKRGRARGVATAAEDMDWRRGRWDPD